MLPAVILAGGLATRIAPLTGKTPKSLLPINNEPFIFHQLRLLRLNGIDRIVLCVGHFGSMILDCVGNGESFGLTVEYSWDGDTLRGTAGAILNALPMLGDQFFVLYGDSYLPCDYRKAEETFLRAGKEGLMTVFRNEGQWDASNVEFSGGRIVAYDKRLRTPAMHYIDYGLGIFRREVFSGLPPGPCDLATVYQDLLARDALAALEIQERFYEIGSFEGMSCLSEFLRLNQKSTS